MLKSPGILIPLFCGMVIGIIIGHYHQHETSPESVVDTVYVDYYRGLQKGMEKQRAFDALCLWGNPTREQIDSASKAMCALFTGDTLEVDLFRDSIDKLNGRLGLVYSMYLKTDTVGWYCEPGYRHYEIIDSLKDSITLLNESYLRINSFDPWAGMVSIEAVEKAARFYQTWEGLTIFSFDDSTWARLKERRR